MPSVNIQPSVEIFQSQFETNSSCQNVVPAGQATGALRPMALLRGSQNVDRP